MCVCGSGPIMPANLDLVLQALKDSNSTSAITTKLWVVLLGNSGWSTKLVVGGSEQNSPSLCGAFESKGETRVWGKTNFEFRNEECKGSRMGVKFFLTKCMTTGHVIGEKY